MTHQYNKLPVTIKMWMQFNVRQINYLLQHAVVNHYNLVCIILLGKENAFVDIKATL